MTAHEHAAHMPSTWLSLIPHGYLRYQEDDLQMSMLPLYDQILSLHASKCNSL